MVAVGRLPMLKVSNFFSQIIIISYMRLKFQSLNIMDPQNMSKPIPYCSNFNKIVFWPWEGVFFIEMKNFKNSLLLYALEHLKTNIDFWNSKIGILSPMATKWEIIPQTHNSTHIILLHEWAYGFIQCYCTVLSACASTLWNTSQCDCNIIQNEIATYGRQKQRVKQNCGVISSLV